MSQHQNKKDFITDEQRWMMRLRRLPLVQNFKVNEVIAYIGLLIVSPNKFIRIPQAMRIIYKSKLHLKIEANSAIPTTNILDALIHLVIYKRKLLTYFFDHEELEVWSDENVAPIFDIMKEINNVYKI